MESDTAQQVPPAAGQSSVPPSSGPDKGKDERMWAMFCHLAGLSGYVVPVPFAGVIGPLVLWLIKKDVYPLVDDQGKEAVNFQITMAICALVCLPLLCVFGLGAVLLVGVAIFDLVFIIMATIKANDGVKFRYPVSIRFIK